MLVCFLVFMATNMPVPVGYSFSQRFAVSAAEAYRWCTDYCPEDLALAESPGGERKITRLTEGTILLTDTFRTEAGIVEKQKLVHLYPDPLQWVSTHLTGPNKYSQFLYKISVEGPTASRLDFTVLHFDYTKESIDDKSAKLLADKLCKEDSQMWALFARAMEKEFSKNS